MKKIIFNQIQTKNQQIKFKIYILDQKHQKYKVLQK